MSILQFWSYVRTLISLAWNVLCSVVISFNGYNVSVVYFLLGALPTGVILTAVSRALGLIHYEAEDAPKPPEVYRPSNAPRLTYKH